MSQPEILNNKVTRNGTKNHGIGHGVPRNGIMLQIKIGILGQVGDLGPNDHIRCRAQVEVPGTKGLNGAGTVISHRKKIKGDVANDHIEKNQTWTR